MLRLLDLFCGAGGCSHGYELAGWTVTGVDKVPMHQYPCADACDGHPIVGVYGSGGAWTRTAPGGGGVKVSGAEAAAAMGVDWTHRQAVLAQMIPPAYTEHIGRQLLACLERAA